MTRIVARAKNDCFVIIAGGHATGCPLACAGISSILFALAGWLENAGEAAKNISIQLFPGDAELVFRGGAAARTAFDFALIGLAQIALKHPESVELDVEKAF